MKSLYVRIVLTFMLIAMISSIVGLALTSVYYQNRMQSNNVQKMVKIVENIGSLYEHNPQMNVDEYMTQIAALGFQIYVVNESFEGKVYGSPFKHGKLSEEQIKSVLSGSEYKGMEKKKDQIELFTLFKNSVENTAGIPLQTSEGNVALFIRPDLQEQIGDVRIVMAALLGFTFIISLLLILFLSRLIVRPINQLTKATQQIVAGDFDAGLQLSRKDEIGSLARNFARMTQSIKQLDQMRQEFVANVSHEFQSPLTSIQGLVRAVLNKETTAQQTEDYLTIVEKESMRLSALSKQLLMLASLDKDKQQLQITGFRLDEQIRQLLISLEWQWSGKDLQLELELPEVFINGDYQLLYEVWMNLISNSIKFSESGHSLIIKITAAENVEVEIRDTGKGIPEEDLPYIFERFYKADKARSRSSGSGLGLSIVDKIVTLHKGTVRVESQISVGTAVIVTLPYFYDL